MPNLFDSIFGPTGRRVRGDATFKVTRDAEGNLVMEPVEIDAIVLAPDGSVDRLKVTPDRFYHCGCDAQQPLGGKCAEKGCDRVSCQRCFTRCQHCGKPLCLEHVARLAVEGQNLTFCGSCLARFVRQRRFRALARGLLKPFVRFEEKHPS